MFMAFKIAVPQILGSEFRHYAVFVLSFIAFLEQQMIVSIFYMIFVQGSRQC